MVFHFLEEIIIYLQNWSIEFLEKLWDHLPSPSIHG